MIEPYIKICETMAVEVVQCIGESDLWDLYDVVSSNKQLRQELKLKRKQGVNFLEDPSEMGVPTFFAPMFEFYENNSLPRQYGYFCMIIHNPNWDKRLAGYWRNRIFGLDECLMSYIGATETDVHMIFGVPVEVPPNDMTLSDIMQSIFDDAKSIVGGLLNKKFGHENDWQGTQFIIRQQIPLSYDRQVKIKYDNKI
jgi:hypothetical protein